MTLLNTRPSPSQAAQRRHPLAALLAALLTLAMVGCGGGGSASQGGGDTTTPPPPATTTITLNSARLQLLAGAQPVTLTAAVSTSAAVTWQLAAGTPGSLSSTTGASVNYVAPASGVTAIT